MGTVELEVDYVFDWYLFAAALRSWRLEHGLRQEDVGERLGVAMSTVAAWEAKPRSRQAAPNMQHFLAVCNLIHWSPRWFFPLFGTECLSRAQAAALLTHIKLEGTQS